MKLFVKHLAAFSVVLLVFAPMWAGLGAARMLVEGRIPWISGSMLLSALWTMFLSVVVFSPVATTASYLVRHKLNVRWFIEPLVVLGTLAVPVLPLSLLLLPGDFNLSLIAVISLYVPTLIYYLVLRAIELREGL